MAAPTSYLNKNFCKPDFIRKNGICDVDLVSRTITEYTTPRCHEALASLAGIFPDVQHGPIKAEVDVDATGAETPLVEEPKIPAATQSAVIELISDVWNGSEPLNYHAQIHLGTPPNTFYIDLDTGSTLLWVQSLLTTLDTQISDQNMYIPANSSTSANLRSRTSVTYGDGSTLIASLFTDTISLGGLVATAQLFGAAPAHSIRSAFRGSKSNGLLGLGFGGGRNIVQTLRGQGKVKNAMLTLVGPRNDPKLADKIDRERTMQPRGQLVVGTVGREWYTGEIAWCPRVMMGGAERWIVGLDEVRVNGVVVFRKQLALIDTGTAYIVTSDSVFRKVKAAIPGSEDVQGKRGMFSFPETSLRSMEFVFAGRSLELRKQDFGLGGIVDPKTTRMVSSIVSLPGEGEAFAGLEQLWIIGGIFLDNVVTAFDYVEKKVGFATIASETDVAVQAQL